MSHLVSYHPYNVHILKFALSLNNLTTKKFAIYNHECSWPVLWVYHSRMGPGSNILGMHRVYASVHVALATNCINILLIFSHPMFPHYNAKHRPSVWWGVSLGRDLCPEVRKSYYLSRLILSIPPMLLRAEAHSI